MRFSSDILNMDFKIGQRIDSLRSLRRIEELDFLVASHFAIALSANLDAPVSFPAKGCQVIIDTSTSGMIIAPLRPK